MQKELLYYFEGLDESILRLNNYILDDGFKFIKCNLDEFEKKFEGLIPKVEGEVYDFPILPISNVTASFVIGLERLIFFNQTEIVQNQYVIFLQDLQGGLNEILNSDQSDNEEKRLNDLIKKLKLFESGYIKLLASFEFEINYEGRLECIPFSYSSPAQKVDYSKYSLNKKDLSNLKYFNEDLLIPDYLELAFNSFLEYYNIADHNIKFIMLMMALESVFNKSNQDPIAHIISRHVAMIITIKDNVLKDTKENVKTFTDYYGDVKKLYNIRSRIVHGKGKNSSDKDYKNYMKDKEFFIRKLEKIVREVLQKLIWIHDFELDEPKGKNELWNYLNAKGFPG